MLKVKFGFDYRSMESHLRSRPDLLEIMELQKAPITQPEENAKSPVQLNDIAYWPTGKAICLFYGSTPIGKPREITPSSPVNVLGKIISPDKSVLNNADGKSATFSLKS